MSNPFDWVPFYKELAQKLLPYRQDRENLIRKVQEIFAMTGISMPKLEEDNHIDDMDPFTVYGLFNKSSMKMLNRKKIVEAVSQLFQISSPAPTSFDSIPVLNNLNATFYTFRTERPDGTFELLWNLFEHALDYAASKTEKTLHSLSADFNLAVDMKGNGNSKITMGLYWIAPDVFINLDSRNRWYIYESGQLPESLVASLPAIGAKTTAAEYFEILDKMQAYLASEASPFKDFNELSSKAWSYSQEVNDKKKKESAQSDRDQRGSALADEDIDTVHYWMYAAGEGSNKWDEFYNTGIMAIGWDEIGDLSVYSSKEAMKLRMKEAINPDWSYKNAALATWQFAKEMKPGDIVYVKRGLSQIVGRGIVTSDYEYDANRTDGYPNIRHMNWTDCGVWNRSSQNVQKTLTDITPYTDLVKQLENLFVGEADEEDAPEPEKQYPAYDKERFLGDVYMDGSAYDMLTGLIRAKKNVILQGAPGVGKTFTAKRLAYAMMGVKDPERVMMVQFHQSYSYEDFIEGFRPSSSGNGFEIRKGSFYQFCRKAADDPDNEYFFIIDEINRGNLSRIFGELFMLIENDKRGNALHLLYSDEQFSVPKKLYIIGMMNTADRSLAMLDYALRRRFAFYEMKPGFESEGFRSYQHSLGSIKFDRLISCVENLNAAITDDDSLGEGFCIGHSYFCNLTEVTDQALLGIVDYELAPLLREYWYDDKTKARDWILRLKDAIR